MDWTTLYFGHVGRNEVKEYIQDEEWQTLRRYLKGKSLEEKYNKLHEYLAKGHAVCNEEKRKSGSCLQFAVIEYVMRPYHVRITNYVTALSRGGLIQISDYR